MKRLIIGIGSCGYKRLRSPTIWNLEAGEPEKLVV